MPACFHEHFEAHADRTPDALALTCGDIQLTYRELDRRANQLARHLQSLGVGPDVLVAICIPRSVELVVAMLGVWKAGGAYLPIDPSYPKKRARFMLTDSCARVAITTRVLASEFAHDAATLCIDDLDLSRTDARLPTSDAGEQLAYVIYTSGSTGQPKGVMIHQRGLSNYVSWAIGAYDVDASTRSALHSSTAFDLTITSLLPLAAGGGVVLVSEDAGSLGLVDLVRRPGERLFVKLTPQHLNLLTDTFVASELAARIRMFVIGGEQLLGPLLRGLGAEPTRIINEYGPTEAVVGCCIHEVGTGDDPCKAIPIGKPIANTQLHVLDEYLASAAIGELYIGGAGVARGYFGRPDLTAERFVPDPFGYPGDRLYRTGDLVIRRSDGVFEYIGRLDHQVKVRGFRIELGEIEAALANHEELKDVVIATRDDPSRGTHLVAYTVARGTRPTITELRRFVAETLPEYMVPAVFVWLDAIPLTTNGKVDRSALLAAYPPQIEPLEAGSTLERLVAIWRDLLATRDVESDDSFFDIGGNSQLAIHLRSRIEEAFGVGFSLANVLEHHTLGQMAAAISLAGPNTAS